MHTRYPLAALVVAATLTPVVNPQVLDRPVATVRLTETVSVGQRELRGQIELLEQQIGRELTGDERKEVLEARIGEVLLDQASNRAGIRATQQEIEQAIDGQRQALGQPLSDAQFRQLIGEQTGMTWSEFRAEVSDRVRQEKFILQRARDRVNEIALPNEREIRQVYEENAQQFTNPAMVRFEHLFFDLRGKSTRDVQSSRVLAADLARQVAGDDSTYGEVLRRSLDDVRYAGGDFGFLLRGDPEAQQQLGRTFVDQVFELEQGDISGVLESSVGLHIVRIVDRRSPRLLELDDPLLPGQSVRVRDQIEAFIYNQREQELLQSVLAAVLEELEAEAEIRRFESNLDW